MSASAVSRARALLRPRKRREAGLFLAEGLHVIDEACAAGLPLREAFASDGELRDDAAALVARLRERGVVVHDVPDRTLREIAATRTPRGVVAVFEEPAPPPDPFGVPGLWLLLDRVQDPGNAGTLLRAAEAFGARGVVATSGTVDLWSPKAVRAGQGAHVHLVVLADRDGDVLAAAERAGGEVWAADASGQDVYSAPPPPPLVLVAVGNEAGGLSPDVLARAARRVAVPQRGRTESLNVAMAGTVLLSWLARGGAGC